MKFKVTPEERIAIAALAMNGILSDPSDLPRIKRRGKRLNCSQSVAVRAVKQADDLIKELEK